MGVGLHIAELPTLGTAPGRKLVFTCRGQTDEALGVGRNIETQVIAP